MAIRPKDFAPGFTCSTPRASGSAGLAWAEVSSILAPGALWRNRLPEELHHFLDIGPYQALVSRIAQQISGMESGHHFDSLHFMPISTQLANWSLDLEQRLHRKRTQAHDHFGPHEIDLTEQERFAGAYLVRFGVAVSGGPAFDDVADIDIVARLY